MSQGEEPSRKRVSARQLTDRDDVDDEVEAGDGVCCFFYTLNWFMSDCASRAHGARQMHLPCKQESMLLVLS